MLPVSEDEDDEQTTRDRSSVRPQPREGFRLVVTSGPDRGLACDLGSKEVRIGKGPRSDMLLTDPTVSRLHCVVVQGPLGPLIRDAGSRNGTVIEGNWIESVYLCAGALVRLGDTTLVVERLDPPNAMPGPPQARLGAALGGSVAMQRIFALVPRLANSDATLLIGGETGTGKTLLASVIHKESQRQAYPFVVIDCGAIPGTLIESELFGHERGAFTGATTARAGAFEAASRGTVLLDEIGELPLEMQPKLLRAIEQRVIRRVGSNEDRAMEVRIIAATNRDLNVEVREKRFRPDLFYRLAAVRIDIPPLRQRPEDIPGLVNHFLKHFSGRDVEAPRDMIDSFIRERWPGNVRELRNAVERAVLLGDLAAGAAQAPFPSPPTPTPIITSRHEELPFREIKERVIDAWEREYLAQLLRRSSRNISRASRLAQMDRNYLRELLRKHGLDPRD
jgi:two-component system, NtrC family, response regulator GlrR